MLADDLADLLSSGGCGTVATSIFVGRIPDDVETGIAVVETGGAPPIHTFGSSAPTSRGLGTASAERPSVQIMTRSPVYATARALAQDAFSLVDGLKTRTINGRLIHWAQARSSPFDLGRDENERSRWAMNFDLITALSSSTST